MKNIFKIYIWLATIIGISIVIGLALYMQHVEGSVPCVNCIYIRVAFISIILTSILGLAAYKLPAAQIAMAIANSTISISGLKIAYNLRLLYKDPSLMDSCEMTPSLWIPLHKWMPSVFEPRGLCDDPGETILSLTMTDWSMIIFAELIIIYLITAMYTTKQEYFK